MITRIPNLLTPDQCQELIDAAEPNLHSQYRIAHFNIFRDPATHDKPYPAGVKGTNTKAEQLLSSYTQFATGTTANCIEPLEVVHYPPGFEGYMSHHDGFFRKWTLLVYLNDAPGCTQFEKWDQTVQPETGLGVLFENTIDALHSIGPTDRDRWVAVLWTTRNPYDPDLRFTPAEQQAGWDALRNNQL